MEACPTENKEKAMSLLHSFYCWGHMGVVLISTAFFALAGISNWKILALIWAAIPLLNAVLFSKAPMYSLNSEGEKGLSMKELFSKKDFLVFNAYDVVRRCIGAGSKSVGVNLCRTGTRREQNGW